MDDHAQLPGGRVVIQCGGRRVCVRRIVPAVRAREMRVDEPDGGRVLIHPLDEVLPVDNRVAVRVVAVRLCDVKGDCPRGIVAGRVHHPADQRLETDDLSGLERDVVGVCHDAVRRLERGSERVDSHLIVETDDAGLDCVERHVQGHQLRRACHRRALVLRDAEQLPGARAKPEQRVADEGVLRRHIRAVDMRRRPRSEREKQEA